MSLTVSNNEVLKTAMDILESASKQEQKRMLYLLKLEMTRSLARKLDKRKPQVKKSDKEITETIHRIRKSYGRK